MASLSQIYSRKRYRMSFIEKGLCPRCRTGRLSGNHTYCEECLKKNRRCYHVS